jgi:hypothetical protein
MAAKIRKGSPKDSYGEVKATGEGKVIYDTNFCALIDRSVASQSVHRSYRYSTQ